ncbi:MAG: hypothetical protein SH856_08245 [Flavobacteriales bacterium]|nr:hypothetical protein [Flavobacteriales bacterium]
MNPAVAFTLRGSFIFGFMMSAKDNEILDLPDDDLSDNETSRWKFLNYLAIALIAAGVVGWFSGHYEGAVLISVGLGLLLFRTTLLFILREKKYPFEYFYLAGMSLLIILYVLRILHIYSNQWLLLVAACIFTIGIFLVRTKDEEESGSLD